MVVDILSIHSARARNNRSTASSIDAAKIPAELKRLDRWLLASEPTRHLPWPVACEAARSGETIGVALGAEVGIVPVPIPHAVGSREAASLVAHVDSYAAWVGQSELVLIVRGKFGPQSVVTRITGRHCSGTPLGVFKPGNGTAGRLREFIRRGHRRRPQSAGGKSSSHPFQGGFTAFWYSLPASHLGHRQNDAREAEVGLLVAKERAERFPDPVGLNNIHGRNKTRLRAIAKLAWHMCRGRAGTNLFLGCESLGKLFGTHHESILRVLRALEEQGILTLLKKGSRVRVRDPTGRWQWQNWASTYRFNGL